MIYISLTICKVALILSCGSKKRAHPDKTTSAYMADKRHSDVYTVVGRDWDYFQVLKVACLSGFFRGWVASKTKNLVQPTEKEPKA
jgi:hypothetical protein